MSPQDGDGMGGWQAEWEREEKRLREEWMATVRQQVESPDAVQREAAKLEDFIKDQKDKFVKEKESKAQEQAPADGPSAVDEEKQKADQRVDQSVSQDKDLQAQATPKEQLGSIDELSTSQEQQTGKQRDYSAMRLQQAEMITTNGAKDERVDEGQQGKTDGEGKSAAPYLDRATWEKGRLEELKDTIARWDKQALQQEINRDWSPVNTPDGAPRDVRTYEEQKEVAHARVNKAVRDLLNDEFAKKQATIEQDETKKTHQDGLDEGKSAEKNVAEFEQASQKDTIPARRLHNQPPRDYSALEMEAVPVYRSDHQQTEQQSIDADRMEVALQERERQAHEKAMLEAEVRRGMQNGEQRVVEEPQPTEKTQVQSGYMESLAFNQKRNEEVILERESLEREKALEEIKRRREQEAELRKELNKKRGLGLGD